MFKIQFHNTFHFNYDVSFNFLSLQKNPILFHESDLADLCLTMQGQLFNARKAVTVELQGRTLFHDNTLNAGGSVHKTMRVLH